MTPIHIVVVGHANAGKTSLMRTLLRSETFGEVMPTAGTTRHVETATIHADGQPLLSLFDTPGFEDSIGLMDTIHEFRFQQNLAESELLEQLVAHASHSQFAAFEQEFKILRQLQSADIIFYLVDVREPQLGKYLDELQLLGMAAKPIVPILNFVASAQADTASWKRQLAQKHLHTYVEYDTVAFHLKDEQRLYQTLQSLLPARYDDIQHLIEDRRRLWQQTLEAACELLADLLIRAAGYRLLTNGQVPMARLNLTMQDWVRQAEQRTLTQILQLYQFHDKDVLFESFPISGGHWQLDLFDPDNLSRWGVAAGRGAASGAAIGAGLDLAVGGLSLGAATATGALIGACYQSSKHYKDLLKAKFSKQHWVCLDDNSMRVLLSRQIHLIQHLQKRGHASQQVFQLNTNNNPLHRKLVGVLQGDSRIETLFQTLKSKLKLSQQHPEWWQADQDASSLEQIQALQAEIQQDLVTLLKVELNSTQM